MQQHKFFAGFFKNYQALPNLMRAIGALAPLCFIFALIALWRTKRHKTPPQAQTEPPVHVTKNGTLIAMPRQDTKSPAKQQ